MPKAQDDELVMNLVELASGQPPESREAYVRSACAGDVELFREVWEYVRWNHRMQDFLLEPLYAPLPEPKFEPGDLLLDRFRIVREVAQGGMGIVYEAEDERLGRRIALKCAKSGFHTRLPPEVRHASEITHPNVCRIFEIHTAPTHGREIDFLTMEFLDGETLAARLSGGRLAKAEARTIGRQICAGLAEAHRNRVVHGDLKSSNIILTRDAHENVRAVITDFGLARRPLGPAASNMGSWAATVTGSSQAAGTPDYMAPELWKGEKASAASDVYALGVILYELASGDRPYSQKMKLQERLKQRPPAVRDKWDPILQRCLDPDPAKRFEDAGEVALALEPSRALRWWMVAAAAVLLAAASGLVTFQRATAPKEFVNLAMLPLEAGPAASPLADVVSRGAAAQMAHLNGGKRARLKVIPLADVTRRHVDSAAKARAELKATHVVSGTITRENGRVVLHAFLIDTRNQTNSGDWRAEYAPGEVRYAPTALAGMITAALHLPPLAVAPVNASAQPDYEAGLAYARRNSTVSKALPLLEQAVAADPDSPLTWAGLAEAQWFEYFITSDPLWLDRTSESLRQAQDRDFDLALVHRVSGLLRANAGSYEQAEAEYQRAIELEPLNGETYRRLGQVYQRSNRLDQALAEFEKAVELEPNNFKSYQDLGTFYRQRGDRSKATQLFEKCAALAPDEPDAHYALGTVYSELGRFAEAEREFRAAIQLDPKAPALNNLGVTLMSQGKDLEAIPFFIQASNAIRGQYLVLMNLGTAYRRSDQLGPSKQAYERSLELAEKELARDPRDGLVRSRVAYLCANLGNRPRAESEIAQALRLSPEDDNARDMAVDVYEALGRRDDTLAILRASPDAVLLDALRWPDLAELHRDSRFQELLASHQIK
ncbi:MAG: tetratricopeptide repeat protein [Bryobacterales bacterium]|nr:tetratricopeptide repeat protein [Bryobacterales bacterium]